MGGGTRSGKGGGMVGKSQLSRMCWTRNRQLIVFVGLPFGPRSFERGGVEAGPPSPLSPPSSPVRPCDAVSSHAGQHQPTPAEGDYYFTGHFSFCADRRSADDNAALEAIRQLGALEPFFTVCCSWPPGSSQWPSRGTLTYLRATWPGSGHTRSAACPSHGTHQAGTALLLGSWPRRSGP